jgi:hypothetical protein
VLSGGKQIFFVDAVCLDTNGAVTSRARAIYRRFDRRITAEEAEAFLAQQSQRREMEDAQEERGQA